MAGDGKVPVLQARNKDYPFFRKGDLDSLPMLFLDNLSTIVGVVGAMTGAIPGIWGAALSDAHKAAYTNMIYEKVCPAVAFSLMFGNIWYGWMAHKLAGYESRTDVTALPYGINTPVGFAVAFGVMLPLGFKYSAQNLTPEEFADKIWATAACGCFISGIFETLGAFCGAFVRRNLSKAAIYAPIASVGFVWLAMSPLAAIGKEPIIGVLPLGLCFVGFFANKGLGAYKRVPPALLIIIVGVIGKWADWGKYNPTQQVMSESVETAAEFAGRNTMRPFLMFKGMPDVGDVLPILLPFALQSFIETMELVEAAAAKGDHYPMMESMIVDGVGTMFGAVFGSPLPTTVYVGHARHKAVGASAGYSIVNAFLFTIILLAGLFPVIFACVDAISIGCILLAVGLLITQQAFECTASRHYPALAVGIMCIIFDYCRLDSGDSRVEIKNMAAGGGIVVSLVLTQLISDLIDLRLERCFIACLVAIFFSTFGIMHGNNPTAPEFALKDVKTNDLAELTVAIWDEKGELNEGWRFTVAYAMLAVFVLLNLGLQKVGLIPAAVMDDGSPEAPMTAEAGKVEELGVKGDDVEEVSI